MKEFRQTVQIPLDRFDLEHLEGSLVIPTGASGMVLFAHGSGSGRLSPRNRYVAEELQKAGLATLLFDLLTRSEGVQDEITHRFRFDIALLTQRLNWVADWIVRQPQTKNLKLGYFGASTGAAAALLAAAQHPERVTALVSRGGRPDLAGSALVKVQAPTLLIVGGWDEPVIELNRQAYQQLCCDKKLVIVPEATHLFEEPGKLAEVARLAKDWFAQHLIAQAPVGEHQAQLG